MNGKEWNRQSGDLPEEMIADTMSTAKPMGRKKLTGRIMRIAAAAVAVVILLCVVISSRRQRFAEHKLNKDTVK